MRRYRVLLPDEGATARLAALVAGAAKPGWVLFLEGELAAGKTSFARAFLHALGHVGPVKSPTFTVVEPYETPAGPVHHFDLYRINDREELHYLGFDDTLATKAICLIEWPSRALAELPSPEVRVFIEHVDVNVRKCELSVQPSDLQKALEEAPEITVISEE